MSIDKNGNSLMDNLFNVNINFNLKLLENPNVKSEHANAQVISIILPEYTEKNIKIIMDSYIKPVYICTTINGLLIYFIFVVY